MWLPSCRLNPLTHGWHVAIHIIYRHPHLIDMRIWVPTQMSRCMDTRHPGLQMHVMNHSKDIDSLIYPSQNDSVKLSPEKGPSTAEDSFKTHVEMQESLRNPSAMFSTNAGIVWKSLWRSVPRGLLQGATQGGRRAQRWRRHAHGTWVSSGLPKPPQSVMSHMRNLLGWLRLGWLKIAQIIFKELKLP